MSKAKFSRVSAACFGAEGDTYAIEWAHVSDLSQAPGRGAWMMLGEAHDSADGHASTHFFFRRKKLHLDVHPQVRKSNRFPVDPIRSCTSTFSVMMVASRGRKIIGLDCWGKTCSSWTLLVCMEYRERDKCFGLD